MYPLFFFTASIFASLVSALPMNNNHGFTQQGGSWPPSASGQRQYSQAPSRMFAQYKPPEQPPKIDTKLLFGSSPPDTGPKRPRYTVSESEASGRLLPPISSVVQPSQEQQAQQLRTTEHRSRPSFPVTASNFRPPESPPPTYYDPSHHQTGYVPLGPPEEPPVRPSLQSQLRAPDVQKSTVQPLLQPQSQVPTQKQYRTRGQAACDLCRRKKLRCGARRNTRCQRCTSKDLPCTWSDITNTQQTSTVQPLLQPQSEVPTQNQIRTRGELACDQCRKRRHGCGAKKGTNCKPCIDNWNESGGRLECTWDGITAEERDQVSFRRQAQANAREARLRLNSGPD